MVNSIAVGASSSNSLQNSRVVLNLKLVFKWLWRVCAIVYICVFLGYLVPNTLQHPTKESDTFIYYETAKQVNARKALYISRPRYGPHLKPFGYLYLPPMAAAISPLGHLSWPAFSSVWTILLTLCHFGFAGCLTLMLARKFAFWTFVELTMISGSLLGNAVSGGQIEPLLLLFFGFGVLAIRSLQNRNGIFFGINSLVKINSIWSLFVLPKELIRKSWISALLCLLGGFLAGGFLCGFWTYIDWLKKVPPIIVQGTFDPHNFSISMGVLRVALLCGWGYISGPLEGLPKLWLMVATALGPLTAILLTRKLSPELRVAIVGVAAALFAPICWSSYLPLVLCPIALFIAQKRDQTAVVSFSEWKESKNEF